MRTTGRSGLKRYGFARIGAIDRPLPVVTLSGSRGAVGQGGVFDSHVVPHPRVNPGHCSGLLHLHPMVTPHMPPAPDPHNGLCITIPLATGGTGFREASRSPRRSERRSPHGARHPQGRRRSPRRSVRPTPVRTAHKALNNATSERTQRRNQAFACGRVLRKYRPCVRNQGAGGILRRRSADVPGRGAGQERGHPTPVSGCQESSAQCVTKEREASCAGGAPTCRDGKPGRRGGNRRWRTSSGPVGLWG